jgi:hypothetical protein
MNKPFHLMTPQERTELRIAQNRAINQKIAESQKKTSPAASSGAGVRMTPEERSQLGGVIRKVQK